MASFKFTSSVKISLALFLLFSTTTIVSSSSSRPSPVKCIHHHARLIACARFLEDEVPLSQEKDRLSLPTEACCKNYGEIFRSGTPTCLCRYLHPDKLKTSFNVTKLMSLHNLCPNSNSVPLYDLCVGLDEPNEKFNGIIEVVDRDRVNQRRRRPSMQI